MRNVIKVNSIEGVAPGATATVRVPVGPRYHGLRLVVAGLVNAVAATQASQLVSSVRVLVNGVEQRNLTTEVYQAIARLNKVTVGNLVIPIFFSERWRATATQEEMTSWDTNTAVTFTIEVNFNSTSGGFPVTAPSLVVYAEQDNVRNVDASGKPFAVIVKQLRRNINVPAGEYDITTLPTNFPITRIYLTNSAGTVDKLQVFADDVLVKEATKADNDEQLTEYDIDPTQFGYAYVVDYEQQLSSPLRAQTLNLRTTFSAPGSCSAVVEQITPGF